jgi:hypothetical protein
VYAARHIGGYADIIITRLYDKVSIPVSFDGHGYVARAPELSSPVVALSLSVFAVSAVSAADSLLSLLKAVGWF